MNITEILTLADHGPDTYVGTGPKYPWGGLYGGQIVAQALRAAAATVDPAYRPHSLRAYFIRPGEHTEPIRFEVDRIRNGRSFITRRVVARQAIGAILNMVSRVRTEPLRLRSFSVLRGLRFDDAPDQLEFALTDAEVLVRDPNGKPRYRAEVVADAPASETVDLPAFSGTPVSPYDDGALFHGPALRGIHALLAEDDEHLVLRCELPDASLGDGGYRTPRYSPVLADLLLQAALVRVHRSSGRNCLPTAVGAIDVHDGLPDGSPFAVVVRDVATNGDSVRCTVTACAPDGRVLLRFTDVDVVCSDGLAEQFTSRGE